jgi:hypothetical protein
VIRHVIKSRDLKQRIEEIKPGWTERAKDLTQAIPEAPAKASFREIWSEIKKAYIGLQGSKCAYCEKSLEDDDIEHDVEHFRPKGSVSRWIPSESLSRAGVVVNQPTAGTEPGYRFLAYHPRNYAASCKQCNTILKGDRFPIRGHRRPEERDVIAPAAEEAYLIYPIGDVDDDPEALIEFAGISPRPKGDGFGRLRALAVIEFFRLDDSDTRGSLLEDRAEQIVILQMALRQRDRSESPEDVSNAKWLIDRMTGTRYCHANCLRSFKRLYDHDPVAADDYAQRAKEFLESYVPRSLRSRPTSPGERATGRRPAPKPRRKGSK